MAGQVEGSTWSGINVPRRCLGRRWDSTTSPATTCSTEAIPRDSAVSSVSSYYSLQREPDAFRDNVSAESVRTGHENFVTESPHEDTAWVGTNVPRRSNRWSWTSYSSTAADTDRNDDFENGNRVDNRTSPKRQARPEAESETSESWAEIDIPRRSRAFGGRWGSNKVSESRVESAQAASVVADSNGNHVAEYQAKSHRLATTAAGAETIDSSSKSRNDDEGDHTWGGINVPKRTRTYLSSVSTLMQERPAEDVYTSQKSRSTSQFDSSGTTDVSLGTMTSDIVYGSSLGQRVQARESETSSSGGISIPKRTSSMSRNYDISSSPPKKQHKMEHEQVERIQYEKHEAHGSWAGGSGRNYGTSRYEETMVVSADKGDDSLQAWGGINVPRRTSRSRYSSYTSARPDQQTQTVNVETPRELSTQGTEAYIETSVQSCTQERRGVETSKSEIEKAATPEESYFSRYVQRTSTSKPFQKAKDDQLEPGHYHHAYKELRQHYEALDSNVTENKQSSWGRINVPRRTSNIDRYGYSTSPSRQQLECSEPVKEISATLAADVSYESNVSRRNREERSNRYNNTAKDTLKEQNQENIFSDQEGNTSESWRDINSPRRRTGNSPRSLSASNVTELTQHEAVGTNTETTCSSAEDSWGGIGVPRRSSRSYFHSTSQRDTMAKGYVRIEEPSSKYPEKEHIKIGSNIQHDKAKPTDTEESVETSWEGINVPRRTSSFRSSYTSNLPTSKDPNTETIPHKSNISEIHQVEESSRAHSSSPRLSGRSGSSSNVAFNTEVENAYTSPERISRCGVKRSKSVKWSNSKSPPRSASEVTPIIRSRSRSREDLQRWSTTEVPQTERSRSLIRSRSFTSSSSSRRSVSPRGSRERSKYSPSKVMTYKVESSPAKALKWSWTPASPLDTKRHQSDTDQSDTDEVFEKKEEQSWSGINVRRTSYRSHGSHKQPKDSFGRKHSETKETSRSRSSVGESRSSTSSARTGRKESYSLEGASKETQFRDISDRGQRSIRKASDEEIQSSSEEGYVKWSTLEENRRRLASTYTAWELGRSQSVDQFSSLTSREYSSSQVETSVTHSKETPDEGRWGGIDVPRRCLGYAYRWRSNDELSQKSGRHNQNLLSFVRSSSLKSE